jgi:hypothetical protein
VRLERARARRRRRGGGVGAPSQCGNEQTWVLRRAPGRARARWLPVGVGVGHDGTSQRGSRRSPVRRHGRRRARRPRSVRASTRGFTAGGRARSGRLRTGYPLSSPTRYGARGSRPLRGRGGMVRSSTAAASYMRGKGQGSTWPPRDRLARVMGCMITRASGWRNDA